MKISSDVKFDEAEFTQSIADFAQRIQADPHHRLRSWHHAHAAWQGYLADRIIEDHATLHLAFYLASWGMYRGSSDLLYRDYLVLKPAVRYLRSQASSNLESQLFEGVAPPTVASSIARIADDLAAQLKPGLKCEEEGISAPNPSDTLLSKILFVTLGAVPAFDTEVKKALRKEIKGYKSGNSFVQKKLAAVIELARANQGLIDAGKAVLEQETKLEFTRTLVLDLYLWGKGRKLNEAKKSKAG